MDSRNTIGKILNKLERQLPLFEVGEIIETIKTLYPPPSMPKDKKNIILEGVSMTAPLASSRETKSMLSKEKSPMLEIFKNIDRGDILVIKSVSANKIIVENLSLKEKYRKPFTIEKLDVIKGNFNVIKRKSIDLAKTLNCLMGND